MERKIKQIIENTVKQVINELDWKTYDQAARKAEMLANDDSLSEFEKQRRLNQSNAFDNAATVNLNNKFHTNNDEYNNALKYIRNYDNYEINGLPKDVKKPSNGTLKNLDKLSREVSDYNNGKYKYKNGKWSLKKDEDEY